MEVIYYKDPKLGYAPVNKYLIKYVSGGSPSSADVKLLRNIKAKIHQIRENRGFIMNCEFCEKATDFDGWKIKQNIPNKRKLRILYSIHDEKMLLLVAFDKPAYYKTNKEKRREVQFYETAKKYLKIFKNNPTLYEQYQ